LKRKTTSELLGTMNFPKIKNLDRLGDGGAFSEKTRQSADLAIERERHVTSRHVASRHVTSRQTPVVQRMHGDLQQLNHYSFHKYYQNPLAYPLQRDVYPMDYAIPTLKTTVVRL